MIKMLIVDDEKKIRESLEKLDWAAFGIEVVGVCDNGVTAYHAIRTTDVDIVLTDVCMPVMDGIELAETLQREFPDILVVVLSGYDEYEYIRKCLSCHVFEYLLKPLRSEDLNRIFSKAAQVVNKRRQDAAYMQLLERRGTIALQTMRREFLGNLITRPMTRDEILQGLSDCEMQESLDNTVVAVFRLDETEHILRDDELYSMVLLGAERAVDKVCRERNLGYCYADKEKLEFAVLIVNPEYLDSRDSLRDCVKQIKKELYTLGHIMRSTVSCAVGKRVEGGSVYLSYRQAEELLTNAPEASDAVVFCEDQEDAMARGKYIINRVVAYIQENYDRPITLSTAAEQVFVNPAYLSYLFKKSTGEKFIDYLTGYRINKAKKLLRSPEYKVNEIARMVGYENPSYFSLTFKKICGVSPHEFRSRYIK